MAKQELQPKKIALATLVTGSTTGLGLLLVSKEQAIAHAQTPNCLTGIDITNTKSVPKTVVFRDAKTDQELAIKSIQPGEHQLLPFGRQVSNSLLNGQPSYQTRISIQGETGSLTAEAVCGRAAKTDIEIALLAPSTQAPTATPRPEATPTYTPQPVRTATPVVVKLDLTNVPPLPSEVTLNNKVSGGLIIDIGPNTQALGNRMVEVADGWGRGSRDIVDRVGPIAPWILIGLPIAYIVGRFVGRSNIVQNCGGGRGADTTAPAEGVLVPHHHEGGPAVADGPGPVAPTTPRRRWEWRWGWPPRRQVTEPTPAVTPPATEAAPAAPAPTEPAPVTPAPAEPAPTAVAPAATEPIQHVMRHEGTVALTTPAAPEPAPAPVTPVEPTPAAPTRPRARRMTAAERRLRENQEREIRLLEARRAQAQAQAELTRAQIEQRAIGIVNGEEPQTPPAQA